MATILWRPMVNALTTPLSYRVLIVPRGSAGTEDLAEDIALRHPNFNKDDIVTVEGIEPRRAVSPGSFPAPVGWPPRTTRCRP